MRSGNDPAVSDAQSLLAEKICLTENSQPHSFVLIMTDSNSCFLSHELPNYKELVTCATCDKNTLDHFSSSRNTYRSTPCAPLGLSDHCIVQMVPTYKQQLKRAKPTKKTTKRWTPEAIEMLQDCMESSDWEALGGLREHFFADNILLCQYLTVNKRVSQLSLSSDTIIKSPGSANN